MQRTVTVTGHGTVEVAPDIAEVWMGVQATRADGERGDDHGRARSRSAWSTSLKGAGIAEEDIQTSGLSLYPNYSGTATPITGYTASAWTST